MPQREYERKSGRTSSTEQDEDLSRHAPTDSTLDDDIDAILDEIDDVLEENAEDFVKSFVQKGGQ